jgi:uncharacterized protein YndB with AHSA1/START domain
MTNATQGDEQMSDAPQIDEQDYGQLDVHDGKATLRYARRLAHPAEAVWRALTEPKHLEAWFPTTIDGERASGAPLSFAFREMELEPMQGEMLAYEPPSLMELRWGEDTLRFALEPDGPERCTLSLTVAFEQFGKIARDGAGWHSCLDRLAYDLAGEQPPFSASDRWRIVNDTYVERLGPEASKIGLPQEWERAHGSASAEAG